MPLSLHTATRRQGRIRGAGDKTPRDASSRPTKAFYPALSLCDLIFSGVFERHPRLTTAIRRGGKARRVRHRPRIKRQGPAAHPRDTRGHGDFRPHELGPVSPLSDGPCTSLRRSANVGAASDRHRHSRETGCQEILRTGRFVVPAKAGTQEQATEIPGPRLRGNDGCEMRAADFVIGLHPRKREARVPRRALEPGIPAFAGMTEECRGHVR